MISIPLIIEEVVTTEEYKQDMFKTSGGTLFTDISMIGKIMSRNSVEVKEDGGKKPPSISIGDLDLGITIKCIPSFQNTQIWDYFLSLDDNDVVHIVGSLSFFRPEAKGDFVPPVSKSIVVKSITRITDDDYINAWYSKLLKIRKNDKIPMKSKIFENFVKKHSIKYEKDGNFFIIKESDILTHEVNKKKITFKNDEDDEQDVEVEKKKTQKPKSKKKSSDQKPKSKKKEKDEEKDVIEAFYDDETVVNEKDVAVSNTTGIKKFLKQKK